MSTNWSISGIILNVIRHNRVVIDTAVSVHPFMGGHITVLLRSLFYTETQSVLTTRDNIIYRKTTFFFHVNWQVLKIILNNFLSLFSWYLFSFFKRVILSRYSNFTLRRPLRKLACLLTVGTCLTSYPFGIKFDGDCCWWSTIFEKNI